MRDDDDSTCEAARFVELDVEALLLWRKPPNQLRRQCMMVGGRGLDEPELGRLGAMMVTLLPLMARSGQPQPCALFSRRLFLDNDVDENGRQKGLALISRKKREASNVSILFTLSSCIQLGDHFQHLVFSPTTGNTQDGYCCEGIAPRPIASSSLITSISAHISLLEWCQSFSTKSCITDLFFYISLASLRRYSSRR